MINSAEKNRFLLLKIPLKNGGVSPLKNGGKCTVKKRGQNTVIYLIHFFFIFQTFSRYILISSISGYSINPVS